MRFLSQFFLLLFILIFQDLNGQNNEIGVFFGGTNYIGDVGPTTYINPLNKQNYTKDKPGRTDYVVGILYKKNLSNRLAGRFGFNIAKIHSSDYWSGSSNYRKQRGKWFSNKIEELNLSLEFNFNDYDTTSDEFQHTFYIRSGISYFRFDDLFYPEGINKAQSFAKHNTFSIPISVGYKIKPLKSFALGFEITANQSFTENLDGRWRNTSPRLRLLRYPILIRKGNTSWDRQRKESCPTSRLSPRM